MMLITKEIKILHFAPSSLAFFNGGGGHQIRREAAKEVKAEIRRALGANDD
jgi:hypothetical protein